MSKEDFLKEMRLRPLTIRKRLLTQYRMRANYMTAEELAEKIGMTKANYLQVESGRLKGSIETFFLIQKELNIPNEMMWDIMSNGGAIYDLGRS